MDTQAENHVGRRLRHRSNRRDTASGFTLIELMITIGILAIIVGVAIPSYTQYVLKAGRSDAQNVLMQASQTLERCFTRYSAYNDGDCPLANGATVMSENDKYQLTVASTATTFDLTAAPQSPQDKDTECGSFTLDETGARGISASNDPDDVAECW